MNSAASSRMDGVIVIDKPHGITSHDVVAVARRALREKRIGHTGTLDPLATGVLPLAIGRATRLVRFLTASDKDYLATIRFGLTTDSYDITGAETSRSDRVPTRAAVEQALPALTGDYLQMPPAFSAKKVGGRRAYDAARSNEAIALAAAPVRVARAAIEDFAGDAVTVSVTCSAGFYVRTFAHTLGELVGTGACLAALRRTRSGDFAVDRAMPLDTLPGLSMREEGGTTGAVPRLDEGASASESFGRAYVALEDLLPRFAAVVVGDEGRQRVGHGAELAATHYRPADDRSLNPALASNQQAEPAAARVEGEEWVRILDGRGQLVAVATVDRPRRTLHPSIVLI